MQLTRNILTLLPLALSVTAENLFCTSWNGTVPENIRNIPSTTTTAWAKELCAKLTFKVTSGFEIASTPVQEGILGDDGKTWGLQVASHLLRDEAQCVNYATGITEECLGSNGSDGGLMTGPTPFELFATVVPL